MFADYEWMTIAEYVTLAIAILLQLGSFIVMRQRAHAGEAIHLVLVYQLAFMICTTVVMASGPWNWLHLVWLLPACVAASFVVLALLPIPVIGEMLHGLGLLWARVFLIGMNATVTGARPLPK
jgi:hypothetical protein